MKIESPSHEREKKHEFRRARFRSHISSNLFSEVFCKIFARLRHSMLN
jgi:hypothetical protein